MLCTLILYFVNMLYKESGAQKEKETSTQVITIANDLEKDFRTFLGLLREHGTTNILLDLYNTIVIVTDSRITSRGWISKPHQFKIVRSDTLTVACHNYNMEGATKMLNHLEDEAKLKHLYKASNEAVEEYMAKNVPWDSVGVYLGSMESKTRAYLFIHEVEI